MTNQSTRRDFVKQTAAVGATWWMGTSLGVASQTERAKVERLNFACIGVGGKGSSDTDSAGRAGNIVALCDIDQKRLDQKGRRYKSAKKFNDYREMLDEMGDKIDAVTVSTPDHSHAPASMKAMKLGKHCFTQKPLTWSVHEARVMRETAAKRKVATQMGNQGTSQNGLRDAVEVIRAGVIGDVKQVHVWTNRPIWPQGTGRPKPEKAPEHVNWDLFLGPAKVRPYSSAYHPFKWRGWLDFGTGALGDMACHTANMAVMALSLFDPKTVQAIENSGIVENETYPKYSVIKFEFPKRDKLPACDLFWYDGGKKPVELVREHVGEGVRIPNSGSFILGSKGALYSPNDYGAKFGVYAGGKTMKYTKPERSLPRSPGHFKEFAIACKGGKPAMSNFSYAGRLTETILLGNAALRSSKKLEWDAKSMTFTNDKEASKFIKRDYRKGFGI